MEKRSARNGRAPHADRHARLVPPRLGLPRPRPDRGRRRAEREDLRRRPLPMPDLRGDARGGGDVLRGERGGKGERRRAAARGVLRRPARTRVRAKRGAFRDGRLDGPHPTDRPRRQGHDARGLGRGIPRWPRSAGPLRRDPWDRRRRGGKRLRRGRPESPHPPRRCRGRRLDPRGRREGIPRRPGRGGTLDLPHRDRACPGREPLRRGLRQPRRPPHRSRWSSHDPRGSQPPRAPDGQEDGGRSRRVIAGTLGPRRRIGGDPLRRGWRGGRGAPGRAERRRRAPAPGRCRETSGERPRPGTSKAPSGAALRGGGWPRELPVRPRPFHRLRPRPLAHLAGRQGHYPRQLRGTAGRTLSGSAGRPPMLPIPLALLFLHAIGDAPRGRLVIVGGGSIPESVPRHALELAGGPEATVLVVPQASAQPDAGKSSVEMWRGAGASKVSILDLADPAAALASVRDAKLIWMGGGDQNRLVKALAGTGLPEAIRARYVEGAVVGGTSAGAAAMSKAMITGEADLESVTGGATEIVEGLALW